MTNEVVIIAPQDDMHALLVRSRILSRGRKCAIVDFALAYESAVFCTVSSGSNAITGVRMANTVITGDTTIWWRRVQSPISSSTDPVISDFILNERRQALHGCLHAVGARFVNDPFAETKANHKAVQLNVAREAGMRIPQTCITSSGTEARRFIRLLAESGKQTIFKTFTPSRYHMAETRLVTEAEISDEELALAPVIFQECIPRLRDIRVFVAGKSCYSVECVTEHSDLVDWRLDPLVKYSACEISSDVKIQLHRILDTLRLVTGSFDLRVDEATKEPVFLEVNPGGQFLFMETDAGHPVSRAMAQLLLDQESVRNLPHSSSLLYA